MNDTIQAVNRFGITGEVRYFLCISYPVLHTGCLFLRTFLLVIVISSILILYMFSPTVSKSITCSTLRHCNLHWPMRCKLGKVESSPTQIGDGMYRGTESACYSHDWGARYRTPPHFHCGPPAAHDSGHPEVLYFSKLQRSPCPAADLPGAKRAQ